MDKRLIRLKENLYQTQPHPFYTYYAVGYLITRPTGNVLIDAPEDILDYKKELLSLGGIKKHYFTHSHKLVSPATLKSLESVFQGVSERPGLNFEASANHKIIQKKLDEDLEVLYTPGHTVDSIIISWKDQTSQINWFTGDTLFVEKGKLHRAITYSEDNCKLNGTLEALKNYVVNHVYCAVSDQKNKLNLEVKNKADWVVQLDSCKKQLHLVT